MSLLEASGYQPGDRGRRRNIRKDELEYRATGTIVRDMLVGMMQRRGVNQYVAKGVIEGAMGACQGAFGEITEVALAPGARLSQPQVAEAQQILIELEYLKGKADGLPGPKTASSGKGSSRPPSTRMPTASSTASC